MQRLCDWIKGRSISVSHIYILHSIVGISCINIKQRQYAWIRSFEFTMISRPLPENSGTKYGEHSVRGILKESI